MAKRPKDANNTRSEGKEYPGIIRLPGGEPLITRLQLQVGSKSKIREGKKLIVAGKRRREQLLDREKQRERGTER